MRQPPKIDRVTYKDFDINMRIHPATGKLLIKKNDDAVKQAVKTMVLTNHYERPFRPLFGGNVRKQLFENFNSLTSYSVKTDIELTIKNYEANRTSLVGRPEQAITVTDSPDTGTLNVNVIFSVNNTLNNNNVQLSLSKVR